jgi:hypothetical protein
VLPNSAFHHRDHLRLTWLYLRRDGLELGTEHIRDGIRRFAMAHGAGDRFHETLTIFWIRLVQHVMVACPWASDFGSLLAACLPLGEKASVYRHYTRELLATPAARQSWVVLPDLLPLP